MTTPDAMTPERPAFAAGDPVALAAPSRRTAPLVLASPHSGAVYPPEFLAAARLDPMALRRSEDAFIDEVFGAAPEHGAPLLKALFPRAFIDPNREPFELDPAMFEDALPDFANTRSPRVAAGLGTIPRVVASGAEIYRGRLRWAEAEARIDGLYRPYHAALARLIEETKARFGWCLLIDCHSMPSIGGPMEPDAGKRRVDFVLGDHRGRSCTPSIVIAAENFLRARGYAVRRNVPYSGGFTTQHYGRPDTGAHVLQIEINRALYMDEMMMERGPGIGAITGDMTDLIAHLAGLPQPTQ